MTTLEAELLRVRRVRHTRVRYEDLVRDPRGQIERAWRELGLPLDGLDRLGAVMDLEPNHTVAGNPMRFTTGEVTLRPDVEWREKMARRDRLGVAALTLPLRTALGYHDV